MAKRERTDKAESAETILETCPACGSAVGTEETCTQCGAGLDYYRHPPAVATDSASE
jgi:ribosomal protein L32